MRDRVSGLAVEGGSRLQKDLKTNCERTVAGVLRSTYELILAVRTVEWCSISGVSTGDLQGIPTFRDEGAIDLQSFWESAGWW